MREISYSKATLEAMAEEMKRDESVILYGEDIVRQGGIFGQFKGLPEDFPNRVLDTPISETALVGVGVGAAIGGLKPVVDMHYVDFLTIAMDEVMNQAAKIRFMFGGQTGVPMVIRAPDGLANSAAAQHSQSLESWFMHIPGVKVVSPYTAADAKGLLKAAIRDQDPVIYLENKTLYPAMGEVPLGEHIVPIGKARIAKEGTDITIISYSIMMRKAHEVADLLATEGIDAEIIDLRTISPYDKETILESVKKTHKLAIIHESVKQGGVGSEIAAFVAEEAIEYLDARIMRFGAPFSPVPFSPVLESEYRIKSEEVFNTLKELF